MHFYKRVLSGVRNCIFPLFFYVFSLGVTLAGATMLVLGLLLVARGGSLLYFVCGVVLLISGIQLFRERVSAVHFAALAFIITWVWAFAEVGLDGWALVSRVDFISVLLPLYALPPIRGRLQPDLTSVLPERAYPIGVAVAIAAVVGLVGLRAYLPQEMGAGHLAARPASATAVETDWRHFGKDLGGTRYSSLSEINQKNANRLKRVWEFVEPNPLPPGSTTSRRDEATPLEVNGKLFVCLSNDVILALDAANGQLLWRHDPRVDLTGVLTAICRGVAYYEDTASSGAPCARRILFGTLDARLIALDADTGRTCEDFGRHGEVSLSVGMGTFRPGLYYITSPPIITRGLVILGGLVQDGVSTGEPSGVIRAFDVRSGRLAWAWDMGNPSHIDEPEPGETYTRGTPNAWSLLSADDRLGLVYVPTGNATPDFVGSHRVSLWEKYSSSVVALEIATGRVRWSFQFVHHDLWDYDTAAQPVLLDIPGAHGSIPALTVATKYGELFLLDRRDGTPVSEVVEKAVPQTDVAGEWTAKTQPFSINMPNVRGAQLREADMWGISPFDELTCRLRLHRLRYEGVFTPPSMSGTIQYPGNLGGVNWGSVTVDNARGLLFVPSFRLATTSKLVPQAAVEKGANVAWPQSGTPYASDMGPFMTILGVPCQRPPYGTLTAIDLHTKAVVWNIALGTAEELGPFGIASHLPFTIGAAPLVGGAVVTAGDVLFIGAVGDRRIRAIDSLTGRELWSDKLPEGNQSTPITYRATPSDKQMLVIVSGAYASMSGGSDVATHVVAYAIP